MLGQSQVVGLCMPRSCVMPGNVSFVSCKSYGICWAVSVWTIVTSKKVFIVARFKKYYLKKALLCIILIQAYTPGIIWSWSGGLSAKSWLFHLTEYTHFCFHSWPESSSPDHWLWVVNGLLVGQSYTFHTLTQRAQMEFTSILLWANSNKVIHLCYVSLFPQLMGK